jgi:uncharacterized phiE125 gp8 family phage protein
MNNTLWKPPVLEPVSLDEVKLYLRLDTDQENVLVEQLIKVARRLIEDYTSRALITQVHRVVTTFDECREIILPVAPFQELAALPEVMEGSSIEKISNYKLDTSRQQARVKLNNYFRDETLVRVDYRCGYGDSPDTVPDPLRQAILLLIADLYENRPGENPSTILPGLVRALIQPYRILHVC